MHLRPRMRAIQRHLPQPRHVEVQRIFVQAPPERAWQSARAFDAANIPWAKPEAEAFVSFSEPGWGKVAWSIHVEPFDTGSIVTFEVRTTATDDDSWRKLNRYYALIGIGSRAIRRALLSQLKAELDPWPAPRAAERVLDGDDVVAEAHHVLDHTIDIEAPPSMVWPWLMQLGCDRGGWYSIDRLDNGGRPSVEHLVPEWSTRCAGDKLAASPKADGFFDVYSVTPQRSLVIGNELERLGGRLKMSWAFVLQPLGADATRLITRVRARGTPRWSEWLQGAVLYPPVHAMMQRAQLQRLKRLAEREALAR